MSKTFTPCLRLKYKNDKEGYINIRITENRASKYISLRKKIKKSDWDKKRCLVKDSNNDVSFLNSLIFKKIEELKGETNSIKALAIHSLNEKNSLLVFINEEVEHLRKINSIGTSKRFKSVYYHLIKYLNQREKNDITFNEITPVFLREFEAYFLLENLSINSIINYIRALKQMFNKAKDLEYHNLFFPKYNRKKKRVDKKRLTGLEFDLMIRNDFEKGSVLYNVKNFFLFQIFSQGLRVSDLFTIRFSNIKDGRLVFYQFKTKTKHSVLINFSMMLILYKYIDTDQARAIHNKKYTAKIDGKKITGNYQHFINEYDLIKKEQRENAARKGDFSVIKRWKELIDKVKFKYESLLSIYLKEYSKSNSNNFLFPILNNEQFEEVVFNQHTKLSLYHYNQLSSKTALYNKNLKKLQKACDIQINITSHIARHTYTDMMLSENSDVYDISKSLGHSVLTTTEHYLKDFSEERVDEANNKIFDRFN